jgi:hypothetical protein
MFARSCKTFEADRSCVQPPYCCTDHSLPPCDGHLSFYTAECIIKHNVGIIFSIERAAKSADRQHLYVCLPSLYAALGLGLQATQPEKPINGFEHFISFVFWFNFEVHFSVIYRLFNYLN